MQALLDLPNPSNTLSSDSSLQSFYDAIERHVQSLIKVCLHWANLVLWIPIRPASSHYYLKTRKIKVKNHNSNEWNLRDVLQEAL